MEKPDGELVYYLITEDLNEVANDLLGRDLTPLEISAVEDRLGEFIPWYDAICNAIHESLPKSEFLDESAEK